MIRCEIRCHVSIRFHLHGFGQFDPEHRIGPATWPHFDLLSIHQGRVWLRLCERDEVEIGSGQAVLIYPQTPFHGHSLSAVSRASVQHFAIEEPADDLPSALQRLVKRRRGFALCRTYEDYEKDVRRAVAWSAREPSPETQDLRVAMLVLILSQMAPGEAELVGGPAVDLGFDLDALLDWARGHVARGLSVEDLARVAGLSESHFRSVFARRMGQSAGRFLRGLRLAEAARLLRETRTPIKRIATLAGYRDPAAFHHAFHAQQRLTPGAYRRRYTPRG